MLEKTITVQLPEATFYRLQKAAQTTHRSIDDLLVFTINTVLPPLPNLPSALADELSAMYLFSDDALRVATQPSLSIAQQTRLQQLNQVAKERKLTDIEVQEQERLVQTYHESVLRRTQALAVLSQRGHAVSFEMSPQMPLE